MRLFLRDQKLPQKLSNTVSHLRNHPSFWPPTLSPIWWWASFYLPNHSTSSPIPWLNLETTYSLQSLPIPLIHNRPKWAIQFIPLLISTGKAAGIGTGTAGLTASLNYHQSLSKNLTESLEETATSLITIQNQLDALAVVVLQNRRGLDLLRSEKGGLWLFLEEARCFYANTSGIVKKETESCSVVSDSLWSHGLYSPWNSPGQNPGVACLSLLQGIFPTQGSNPGLPCCRRILYRLSHQVVKEAARNLTNRALRIREHLRNSRENWLSNWNWLPWVLTFLGLLLLLALILTFGPCLMHLFKKFLQDHLWAPTELPMSYF